jgi:hypothetical protein
VVLDRQRRKKAKYLTIAARRVEGWSGRNCAPDALLRWMWHCAVIFITLLTAMLLPFRLSFLTFPAVSRGELMGWIVTDILVTRVKCRAHAQP